MRWPLVLILSAGCGSCARQVRPSMTCSAAGGGPSPPLALAADVDLPGAANRFDYQEIDPAKCQKTTSIRILRPCGT